MLKGIRIILFHLPICFRFFLSDSHCSFFQTNFELKNHCHFHFILQSWNPQRTNHCFKLKLPPLPLPYFLPIDLKL